MRRENTTMSQERTAFVTGGGGGIGAAICRSLAHAGRRVAVADLSLERARNVSLQIGAFPVELDVTEPTSVSAAVEQTQRSIGPIDIAVNCAGWDELKPFVETDEAFTAKVLAINLVGPIRVVRAVLPGMIERRWGRIVNIASDAGRVGSSLEAVYSGAKGGLIAFTKTIAREQARHGVTANTVCPGPTDTSLLAQMVSRGADSEKVIAAMIRAVPMRRLGRPEDIGPAVAFLASEEAEFITGQTLSVSGGLTMA
jgi:2-hydroxycyclohexanecarboxyl-CoA dehydrogenase